MRTKRIYFAITISIVLFLSFAATLSAIPTPTGPDYYKSKLITYIVATKPGGGYDAYARLIGRYMQKYIPGSTIAVKNAPGAGHILGANETFLERPNGLTMGTFNTGLIYAQLVGMKGVKFDLTKFDYIGKATSEPRLLVVNKKTPYKTMKEFMESPKLIKMGSSGVGSQNHNETLILIAATGVKNIKAIGGYPGKDLDMGLLRGEIDGTVGSYDGLFDLIKSGEVRPLMQFTNKKWPGLENVPTTQELNIPERGKKLLALVSHIGVIGRLTAVPPHIRPERLAVLRDAYHKALNDPAMRAEGKKVGFEFDPLYGNDVVNVVKEALNQPPENLALLKEILRVED